LPSIDVEMLEVVYPVTDCNINQSNVVVKAKNNGTLPISNIPLKYQVNGSSNIIGEYIIVLFCQAILLRLHFLI